MKTGMPFEIRRRCELTMTRFKQGDLDEDTALQELFKLMKFKGAENVAASEFQTYVDAIMMAGEAKRDPALEEEVYKTWKS
jgi:hypothetical protein